MTPDTLQFKKQEIIEVLRNIEGIVVSLDRLTMAHADMPEDLWKEAVFEYFLKSKALMALPSCRAILSAPFCTELEDDDMGELERAMDGAEYWSYKDFMSRHPENSKP
ncbi:hypothetical protein [Pseudoduganella violacea]|uniref:Uncharacterized protein n=1 Tax=Pseudoduganella violacea TaxID=1715466 RepID=A0A7W5FUW2_9BURK|nr:hypothetical protein [Pseudoduganella violacea]MBB3120141.1 hypothetical protein [Pseudoduganella violacea]